MNPSDFVGRLSPASTHTPSCYMDIGKKRSLTLVTNREDCTADALDVLAVFTNTPSTSYVHPTTKHPNQLFLLMLLV